MRIFSAILLASVFTLSAQAQLTEHKLVASDGYEAQNFGYSVALLGDRALIGARDSAEVGNGSAYVFERQGDDSWLEVAKLIASDGAVGDYFGGAVSLSEDRAIVGAWKDDDLGDRSGSAYIFERQGDGSWLEVAKILASDGGQGQVFGRIVSISGDLAMVGAYRSLLGAGSVYVFERQGDGSWLEVDQLTASDGESGDFFGFSVSISEDGAIVGAWADKDTGPDSGSAYMFERQGDGSWLEVAKLSASDAGPRIRYGWSVALFEVRAFVGAHRDNDLGFRSGSVYVYERQGDGSWLEVDKLLASDGAALDHFGRAVSLWGDRALVASYLDDDNGDASGSAYVLERQGDGSWLEVAKLTASDGAPNDVFGWSVSLSGDGALVGAFSNDDLGPGTGSAYVFDLPPLMVTCTPVSPPIVIPAAGGSYAFDIEIVNTSTSEETFDIWFDIDGPGFSRTRGPTPRTLAPGVSLSGTLDQYIPGVAPPGDYVHTCSVGTFPTADNSSSFDFEKSTELEAPANHVLESSYPNPFNPSTTIRFSLPESAPVRLAVYDVLGRQVLMLLDGTREAGTHEVVFDASDLPSGTYLYRLETPQGSYVRTMLLAK